MLKVCAEDCSNQLFPPSTMEVVKALEAERTGEGEKEGRKGKPAEMDDEVMQRRKTMRVRRRGRDRSHDMPATAMTKIMKNGHRFRPERLSRPEEDEKGFNWRLRLVWDVGHAKCLCFGGVRMPCGLRI